jgi:hypothetical protein
MTSPWRCSGCGIEGRVSTIAVEPRDQRPVLTIVFDYQQSGRPVLVCQLCRDAEALPTPRPRASEPEDGDYDGRKSTPPGGRPGGA